MSSASMEDRDAAQEAHGRGDRWQAARGRRAARAGQEGGRGGQGARGERGELRDELLDREIFYSLREAQVLIEAWRRHYNAVRPHSALGYRPPAPEAVPWPAWLPPRPAAGQGADVVYP